MCNAWNHESGCTCGFGGANYSSGFDAFHTECLPSYDRYVDPFAKCPVCREPVFFFQDGNGGRVFFDELGPPWPKHPCTDRSAESGRGGHNFLADGPTRRDQPQWVRDGWSPFILTDASCDRGSLRYHLSGRIVGGAIVWAVIERKWLHQVCRWLEWFSPDSPTFVKRTDHGIEFSGITLRSTGFVEHYFGGFC
jgi:hypothetical protein